MSPSQNALDDRIFESNEELTPEQQKQAADYFEAKGYTVEVETDPGAAPKTEPAKVQDPPAATPKEGEVVPGTPAAAAPPATEVAPLTGEDLAEWEADKTEKKLGYNAKRTQKIKGLTETVAQREARITELDRENAELKGRLAERPAASVPAVNPLQPQSQPAAAAPATVVNPPELPKASEFTKPAPVAPKFEAFAEEDDQQAAYNAAQTAYLEARQDWKDEKRQFETSENQRVQQELHQQTELRQSIDKKFADVRQAHQDFDTVTKTATYSGMLGGVLMQVLDDGLELGYSLALPEHRETLNQINAYTQNIDPQKDPAAAQKAMRRVEADLAVFRYKLNNPTAAAPVNPPAAAAPVVAPPVVNGAPAQAAPPSNGQPRSEPAAPAPVRGRDATPPTRYEDLDPEDVDARLAWRKANGMRF